jgi:hypothetical protein
MTVSVGPNIKPSPRSITTAHDPSISTKSAAPPISPSNPNYRRDSKFSISTGDSARSHKEYIDSLETPTQETVERIRKIQERREAEITEKRLRMQLGTDEMSGEDRQKAAKLIQRNYRGHRERRMLNGMSLDPSTRWVEAVKEARYRNMTEPRSRQSKELSRKSTDGSAPNGISYDGTANAARQNWKKIGLIARRAGGDEDSDASDTDEDEGDAQEREQRRKRRHDAKLERQKAAKIMDLQYFLEMVDLKHRYGSNLRMYISLYPAPPLPL